MPKETIQLNPDKVRLRIAATGKRYKALADGMNEKTIHRIKNGARTSLVMAHKLAAILGTTVADLLAPPDRKEVEAQLPQRWLYEGVEPSGDVRKHLPAQLAIGDGDYMVGRPPHGFVDPLDDLLKWHTPGGRRIVLRRAAHAYVVELHYYEYTPDLAQELDYYAASACRFFPLVRTGDDVGKATLNEFDADWIWRGLQRTAMERGDIVDIEGCPAPAHPRAYVPVARFYRGVMRRRLEGVRVYRQLHGDLRRALIEHLQGLAPRRVHVSAHDLGIQIRIDAVQPAVYDPHWYDDELCIEIDLAWWTSDGRLTPAPWRREHRAGFADALKERKWASAHSPALPLAYRTSDEQDEEDPPLAPDPLVSARVEEAVKALYCLDPEQWDVSVRVEFA